MKKFGATLNRQETLGEAIAAAAAFVVFMLSIGALLVMMAK